MRRYTYDIAHDPHGRDFTIDFNPIETELDLNNFLPEPEGRFLPQYQQVIPVNENEEIQLHVKHPTHEEMEKSSRAIQTVHAAYSKKPPQPQPILEDFDLGIMGYSDFMDPQDEPRASQPYPGQNAPTPQPPTLFRPDYGYSQPAHLYQPKMPYLPKKLVYPKGSQKGLVEKVEIPQVQYNAPLKFQRALFVPTFDEGRLNGLADKAYSKVFMAHGFSKPVPRFYPKIGKESEGIDVAKTLFVPVVIVPSKQQTLAGKQNIDRSSSVAFEPRKIIKKRA